MPAPIAARGDTPILMADGRTKPIADLEVGDAIYGTVRDGRYRRYVTTEVLDHWSTHQARVSGRRSRTAPSLFASGDHRFLTAAAGST